MFPVVICGRFASEPFLDGGQAAAQVGDQGAESLVLIGIRGSWLTTGEDVTDALGRPSERSRHRSQGGRLVVGSGGSLDITDQPACGSSGLAELLLAQLAFFASVADQIGEALPRLVAHMRSVSRNV